MKERGMMSQQQRLVQLSLVGTILLSLLVGVYLFASRRFGKRGPARKIVKHTVDKNPDDALKYWTADKMRAAQPAPMPNVEAHEQEKQH
jgi:hypothetical protein